MANTTDHRKAAESRITFLKAILEPLPASETRDALIRECTALAVAIAAFHMEGIRFRMFNVDRLLNKGGIVVPGEATVAFAEARQHLEAAGFHTRSHQAPS
jgi:hypothetical protein